MPHYPESKSKLGHYPESSDGPSQAKTETPSSEIGGKAALLWRTERMRHPRPIQSTKVEPPPESHPSGRKPTRFSTPAGMRPAPSASPA